MPNVFADIAVKLPVKMTYQYEVPESLRATVRVGSLVKVDVRKRAARGCIVGLSEKKKAKNLKPIKSIISPSFTIDEDLIDLAKWISEYYVCSLGDALQCVSFIGMSDISEKIKTSLRINVSNGTWEKIQKGKFILTRPTVQQQGVIHFFAETDNAPATIQEIVKKIGIGPSPLKTLIGKGVLEEIKEKVVRHDEYETLTPPSTELTLNASQREAFECIQAALENGIFNTFMLLGVTSSGKTEVYMQAIAEGLRRGKQAIVLVPEIALTPQTVERFRGRFGGCVGVYHSMLSIGQKFDLWERIKSGEIEILVGARSAVFAPFPNLGCIVIDEEHENSYKQSESPRYNARDVAVMRGKLLNAVVILGSATPSLESYNNALLGKFELLRLPERIEKVPLPTVELVNMSEEVKEAEKPKVLSRKLRGEIKKRLDAGQQSILFLNRRGFSNFLVCMECNFVQRCPHCDITMTHHRMGNRLICHYCGKQMSIPEKCPKCESENVTLIGVGTQRVESELEELFPDARILRVDLDTVTNRLAFIEKWRLISKGDVDIILGTQMIAKGFHLENVTLVGVVLADHSLFQPDFRSAERTFSLLTQVAGRAGRGDIAGEVLIQTYTPRHYGIISATAQDYEAFAEKELRIRKVLRFPPHQRLISLIFSAVAEDVTRDIARRMGNILRGLVLPSKFSGITILGPVASPIAKLRDRFRWRLLIRGKDSPLLHQLVHKALEQFDTLKLKSKVAITVDVDPQDLL